MTAVTKILFISADPTDGTRLRLGEEMREVRERLQLSRFRDEFELIGRHCVRPTDLTQAIIDTEPDIVHFSGHGSESGSIFLEDRNGSSFPVSPGALEAVFELFSDKIFCVVLNACYSKAQAEAIARKIEHVVGMKDQIGDAAAITFSVGFYKGIINQRNVEDAFQFGLAEMQLLATSEHKTPVLLANPATRRGLIVKDGTIRKSQYHEFSAPPTMVGRVRIRVSEPDQVPGTYALIDPAAYENIAKILDQIYLELLKDRFPPYTYGEKWVLAKGAIYEGSEILAPVIWAAAPHAPIKRIEPGWRTSATTIQRLAPGSDWAVTTLCGNEKFCGIATNNPEVINLIQEGEKGIYAALEDHLTEVPPAALSGLDISRYSYTGVFRDVIHSRWIEAPTTSGIFADPPTESGDQPS